MSRKRAAPKKSETNQKRAALATAISILLISLFGCGEKPPPKIPPDPTFRLQTPQKGQNCEKNAGAKPCRWKIQGQIQGFEVVPAGENPFPRCSTCQFSQKFSLVDSGGTTHILYYQFSGEEAIPLQKGMSVTLYYIDASNQGRGYLFALLDERKNPIAAAASQGGGHLLDGEILGNLTVTPQKDLESARSTDECGIKIFRPVNYSIDGTSVSVAPGETKSLQTSTGLKYHITTVNYYSIENWRCERPDTVPFSFYLYKAADSK